MSQRKSERIVNLTICLLSTRQFLPRAKIRDIVEGYRDLSDAAFERTFERDKDELRALGIPIETGSHDAYFDDEIGYRISRTDFELPAVQFTAAEVTALGMATQVWQQASMAASTVSALTKLRAAGVDPDPARLSALQPAVSANEAAFEPLWEATVNQQLVTFTYRGGDEVRRLEPWRLAWRSGSWYVLGRDVGRDAPRLFKLSRMTTPPVPLGDPGAFEVPELDLDTVMAGLEPSPVDRVAVLAIRDGRAPWLRRRGTPADPPPQIAIPSGWQVVEVGYSASSDFVADLAEAGPDVVVLVPAALRDRVIAHLEQVVAQHAVASMQGRP